MGSWDRCGARRGWGQGRLQRGNFYKMSGYAVNARIPHMLLTESVFFSDIDTPFNFQTQFEQISNKKFRHFDSQNLGS